MLTSYWIATLRAFKQHLSHYLILISSLAAGVACAITVYLFVHHELRYDRHHKNAERIFRIQQNRYNKNELTNSSVAVNYGIGPDMLSDLPEVEAYVQMRKATGGFIHNGILYRTENTSAASADFFKVFSVPLIRGVDSLALTRPFTAVVSESFAKKVFKDEDPVGKSYRYRTGFDLEITGIFADMPETGHMQFDILISAETLKKFLSNLVLEEPWRWDGFPTYIMLYDKDQLKAVESKLPDLIERKTGNWLRETDQKLEINLQPLTSIHLHSAFKDEWKTNGNYQVVFFLAATGASILLITWLTYSSLATVRALGRSREVGIRKVLGSSRRQLAMQFLFESLLFNLVALFIAVLIVYLSLPHLSELFQRNLTAEWKWDTRLVGGLVAFLLLSSMISGLYPAIAMSAISPAEILKGKYTAGKRGMWLRKVMVLVPVTATVILLVSVLVIYLQLDLMRKKDLGFDLEQLMVVRNSEIFDSLYQRHTQAFKKQVAQLAGVENVTMVSAKPGTQIFLYANSVQRIGAAKENVNQYRYFFVDENFPETMGIQVLAGNPVHAGYRLEKDVMINESARKLLGFASPEEAIDQKVYFRDDTVIIRTVLNDYHHQSPKVPVSPTFFVYNPSQCNHYIIRRAAQAKVPHDLIEEKFRSLFTAEIPYIFNLKENYYTQYETEDRFGRIVFYFTTILIVISVAGLFTISSYASRLRMREIGIRKVLGATTRDAVVLLLKEYVLMLTVALIIGLSLAIMGLQKWLESFTLRLQISWWMVVIPALAVSLIILLTVLRQTVRTARANPAEVLKYE
ncbi:MAG: ABC transporter permease [Cyclobacteriaceae bacterium]|nr:ABC transporter permease [Cyclobacteriaceae bacterium]